MTNDEPSPNTPPPPAEPPTTIPSQPDAVPDAPATPKKRASPLVAGIIGLALGAGIVGGIWAITTNNSSSASAQTFILSGKFTLTDEVESDGDGGCQGGYDSGYDDISEGTSVTVYGANGDVVATGQLGESTRQPGGTCDFDITIEDVPTGEKFYKVEVSHRGTIQLSAKEAENGELKASLG